MKKRTTLRIKKDYFTLMKKGVKTLEVRVGYSQIKRIKEGDIISFQNYGQNSFRILRVSKYPSFEKMLAEENASLIVPNKSKKEVLKILKRLYPVEKERLGVYVLEMEYIDENQLKFVKASELINCKHSEFIDLISKSYLITDFICEDYPNHFKWYWEKTVPDIFTGKREVISCIVDNNVVATSILKNDDEKKICTFLVLDEYRRRGIATKLFELSFDYLGTTKPLASIADYKLDMFHKIINKYNWEQTEVLPKGFYNNDYEEIVFNGKIE